MYFIKACLHNSHSLKAASIIFPFPYLRGRPGWGKKLEINTLNRDICIVIK